MIQIENKLVEEAIIEEVKSLRGLSTVDSNAIIDRECKPGIIGIRSQILVDITGKLEEILEVTIPNNCYLFRDKTGVKELSIKEAAEKLIKYAKYAKQ